MCFVLISPEFNLRRAFHKTFNECFIYDSRTNRKIMLAVLFMNRMFQQQKRLSKLNTTLKKSMKTKFQGNGNHCCRTCLGVLNLELIFSERNEIRRSEELKIITGLEIKLNDGLSQYICSECTKIIDTTLKFRRKSRKAQKALLGLASNKFKKRLKPLPNKQIVKKEKDNVADFNDYEKYDMYGGNDFQNDGDYVTSVEIEVQRVTKEDKSPSPSRRVGGATSYKCTTCNKEFRMKATYKAHMRFHTNYCVCESCGKRCRNNNQLQEHKRARHGLGKIHKCAYCEYSSATKEALTIHERRHTGERPYICDHCGSSFHRRSNLVQHIAIHLPDKNFQCDMCPKKLASRKFLQIHKHNAHTGKKYGYLCGVCAHRFEKPNKVRAHARRVHGLPDDQQGAIVRVQL